MSQSQSSIRSFFQAKTPVYTAPSPRPLASGSSEPPAAPPLPPSSTTIPPPTKSSVALPRHNLPLEQAGATVTISPTSTSHPQARISLVQQDHVQPLRRINSLLLPISYPDNFYHKITDPDTSPNFSRVVLWTDKPTRTNPDPEPIVVGGIVCRLDLDPAAQTCEIYVQSLALLSPYRNFGLATALLDEIVKYSVEQKKEPCPITSLYAHVWTDNEDALKWYGARGFVREGDIIHGYYRRLKPDSAIVLRRGIKPSDHIQNLAPAQRQASSTLPPRPNALSAATRAVSYQQKGPAMEWNDLPSDILAPSSRNGSRRPSPNGSTTSLSLTGDGLPGVPASTVKGKKKRVYPTATFGGAS